MEPDDDKRTDFLPRTRCTKSERATIEARARGAGLSLSEYQRRACLDGVVVVRDARERVEVLRQLAAIGNNLNQIARKAHIQGGLNSALTGRLSVTLASLETLLDEAAHGA